MQLHGSGLAKDRIFSLQHSNQMLIQDVQIDNTGAFTARNQRGVRLLESTPIVIPSTLKQRQSDNISVLKQRQLIRNSDDSFHPVKIGDIGGPEMIETHFNNESNINFFNDQQQVTTVQCEGAPNSHHRLNDDTTVQINQLLDFHNRS